MALPVHSAYSILMDKTRIRAALDFALTAVTASAAGITIRESVSESGIMGSVTLPPAAYVLASVFLCSFLAYRIWIPVSGYVRKRKPSTRFRALYSELQDEWHKIKFDQQDRGSSAGRNPGDIYQDRVSLTRDLLSLGIDAPRDPDETVWCNFVIHISTLSKAGDIASARSSPGVPSLLDMPQESDDGC